MAAITEIARLSRRGSPMGRGNTKTALVFLAPWIVGLVAITIGPMLTSLYLSFTDYNLIQDPNWIGLDNFTRMLGDERLWKSLRVTFTYVIVADKGHGHVLLFGESMEESRISFWTGCN